MWPGSGAGVGLIAGQPYWKAQQSSKDHLVLGMEHGTIIITTEARWKCVKLLKR